MKESCEPNVKLESIVPVIPFKGAHLSCAPHPSPYESDSSKWPAKLRRVSENDANIAAALVEVEDEVTAEAAKVILNLSKFYFM